MLFNASHELGHLIFFKQFKKTHHISLIWEKKSVGSFKPIQNSIKPRTTQQSNPPKNLISNRTQFLILRFRTTDHAMRLRKEIRLKSKPLVEQQKAREKGNGGNLPSKDSIFQQILMDSKRRKWEWKNQKSESLENMIEIILGFSSRAATLKIKTSVFFSI